MRHKVLFCLGFLASLWLLPAGRPDAGERTGVFPAAGSAAAQEEERSEAAGTISPEDEWNRCVARAGHGEKLDEVLERAERARVPAALLMEVLDGLQADTADSAEREYHVALKLCALAAAEREIRAQDILDEQKRQQIRTRYLARVEGRYCRFSWNRDVPSYEHRVLLSAEEAQEVKRAGALLEEYAARLKNFLAGLNLDKDAGEQTEENSPQEVPQLDRSRLPSAVYKARQAFETLPESDRQRIRQALIARARGGFACKGGGCHSDLCRVIIRLREEDDLEETAEGIVSVFRLSPEPVCVCSSSSGPSP